MLAATFKSVGISKHEIARLNICRKNGVPCSLKQRRPRHNFFHKHADSSVKHMLWPQVAACFLVYVGRAQSDGGCFRTCRLNSNAVPCCAYSHFRSSCIPYGIDCISLNNSNHNQYELSYNSNGLSYFSRFVTTNAQAVLCSG